MSIYANIQISASSITLRYRSISTRISNTDSEYYSFLSQRTVLGGQPMWKFIDDRCESAKPKYDTVVSSHIFYNIAGNIICKFQ